jgi:Holliday junction resolvase-like predicted endonuclease
MDYEKLKFVLTTRDLLDIRLERYSIRKPNNRNSEMIFCDQLEKELKNIYENMGYKVKLITREFTMRYGRADFIITLENGKYIIIEVKYTPEEYRITNDEIKAMFAVGQLFTYKTALCEQYNVDPEDVEMCLLTNEEYINVLNNILFNNLKISYMVYGENGVKYYGSK